MTCPPTSAPNPASHVARVGTFPANGTAGGGAQHRGLADPFALVTVDHLNPSHRSGKNMIEFDVYLAITALSGLVIRSEEHTSELQSRGHLVCRLLLDKKKKKNIITYVTNF